MHKMIMPASLLLVCLLCGGCFNRTANKNVPIAPQQEDTLGSEAHHEHEHDAAAHQEHEHQAAHGGTLNAIVTCENGHAEARLTGDNLTVWLVGGGSDTVHAVRIPDKSIRLDFDTPAGSRKLVLKPQPLELAGETAGDCSCFAASAPWLQGLGSFKAEGRITFRGREVPLRLEYPKGYDPD